MIAGLRTPPITRPLVGLRSANVFVTGSNGSLGRALTETIGGHRVWGGDLSSPLPFDVTDEYDVSDVFHAIRPEVVFHLAAAKHAPDGEIDPVSTTEVNVLGTARVVEAAKEIGARVVLASTCKAADPETVYGAAKLIAERMVLSAGGSVARLYNVPDSAGNVFEAWSKIPEDEPLPVTTCSRFFVSKKDAVALLLWSAVLEPGRYTINPGTRRSMRSVALETHPRRRRLIVPPRRGDRLDEPRIARCERLFPTEVPRIERIHSPHDPR